MKELQVMDGPDSIEPNPDNNEPMFDIEGAIVVDEFEEFIDILSDNTHRPKDNTHRVEPENTPGTKEQQCNQ